MPFFKKATKEPSSFSMPILESLIEYTLKIDETYFTLKKKSWSGTNRSDDAIFIKRMCEAIKLNWEKYQIKKDKIDDGTFNAFKESLKRTLAGACIYVLILIDSKYANKEKVIDSKLASILFRIFSVKELNDIPRKVVFECLDALQDNLKNIYEHTHISPQWHPKFLNDTKSEKLITDINRLKDAYVLDSINPKTTNVVTV